MSGGHSITVILLVTLLFGCSPKINIRIDSIVDPEKTVKDKYVLYSGMKDISVDDLYFREYSNYFRKILKERGYRLVKEWEKADLVVFFSYGINGGKEIHHTYTQPVYAIVHGDTIDITKTQTDDAGGKTRTTKTITLPTRRKVVGIETKRESHTVFTAYAVLEAKEINGREKATEYGGHLLWKTTITTTSKLEDLRRAMPMMAAASFPYLGKNTGQAVTVILREDDQRVLEMKRIK